MMKKYVFIVVLFLINFQAFGLNAYDKDTPVDNPKIGLVLCGGGALGFSHLGVLQIIDSVGIPIDYVAGTSMGALIGAVYAMGYSVDEMDSVISSVNWNTVFDDDPKRSELPLFEKKETGKYQLVLELKGFTPTLPGGFIHGQKIHQLFSSFTAPFEQINDFNNLPIPFRCVAADLISGNEIVFSNGSLSQALRATMSIPSAFSPVEIGNMLLVDGGVKNNFPTDVARAMGANFIIGVNLNTGNRSKKVLNTLIDILDRTTDLPRLDKLNQNIQLTDLFIETDVSGYSLMDFSADRIKELIEIGRKTARKHIDLLLDLKRQAGITDNSGKRLKSKQMRRTFKNSPPTVYKVEIEGNNILDFSFIYTNLNIKPGEKFDPVKTEKQISYLYSLGYFEKVNYSLAEVKSGHVNLKIKVTEKSFSKLNAGFKYDDYYKLTAIIGVETKSLFVNGSRFKVDYQFGSIRRFDLHLSYPSRTLDLPLYPYFTINYMSIPFDIYDVNGNKFAQYNDRSWNFSAGAGLTLSNLLNLEAEFSREYMNIDPEIGYESGGYVFPKYSDKLSKMIFRLSYDSLDDILLPTEGIYFNSFYENGLKQLESDKGYNKIEIDADVYFTPANKHTIKIGGTIKTYVDNLPEYKLFYFGGPSSFVGIDYNQAFGRRFNIARAEYIYKYKKDIFLRGLFNLSFDNKLGFKSNTGTFSGYGVGVTFTSVLGMLNIIFSRGDADLYKPGDKQTIIYVTAGYKF